MYISSISNIGLALCLAATLLALGLATLWRIRSATGRLNLVSSLLAVVFLATGISMLVVVVEMITIYSHSTSAFEYSGPTLHGVIICLLVSIGFLAGLCVSLVRHKAIAAALCLTGTFASLSVFTGLIVTANTNRLWDVLNWTMWMMMLLSIVVLGGTIAVVLLHTYGRRQYEAGLGLRRAAPQQPAAQTSKTQSRP